MSRVEGRLPDLTQTVAEALASIALLPWEATSPQEREKFLRQARIVVRALEANPAVLLACALPREQIEALKQLARTGYYSTELDEARIEAGQALSAALRLFDGEEG